MESNVIDLTMPKVLSVTEAVKYSGLPDAVIRKLIKTNKVAFVRSGKKYYVQVAALDQIIENGCAI